MVTRVGDGRVSSQSTTHQLPQRDDFIYWDILLELIHHKTTHTSFDQTPVSLLRIGDAGQVDQGGHGSVQLNSTFSLTTLVSTQRECMHTIAQMASAGGDGHAHCHPMMMIMKHASASQHSADSPYESQYRLTYSDHIHYGNRLEERVSRDQSRPNPKLRGQQHLANCWIICIRPHDLTYSGSVILQHIAATQQK